MNKDKLNLFIDSILLLLFLITSVTGLIFFFALPCGDRQGKFQELAGIDKTTFSFFHDWAGLLFIVLIVIHFLLHWKWFTSAIKRLFT